MDAFLALIVAMLVFVVLIFIISRSSRKILFIGVVLVAILVLKAFGVLG